MAWLDIAVLVASFAVLLWIGLPVVFAMGLATAVTLLLLMPAEPTLTTIAQQMAVGIDSFSLVAIPFFVLAGQLMNRGGIARRLIVFANALVGRLPGGLAYVNIVAAMLFGAISGSAVAAASAIGGTMAPQMAKGGIPKPFGAAVNVSSATTGLLIPPSNILIVYSLASGGVSVTALFLAGYLPGILLGLCLMAVVALMSRGLAPARAEAASMAETGRAFLAALPSLLLVGVVILFIVAGICTATEAAAIAVVYTLALCLLYGEMRMAGLWSALREAGTTTAVVLMLIGASMAMSWLLSVERIPQATAAALLATSDSTFVILLFINVLLLLVGMFMDMTPAVLIFTPIFLPVVTQLGLDPVHFGIILVLNLCIGLCTPPVGSVLFVGCSVAGVSIGAAGRALLPFYVAMVAALMLVTYVPWLRLFVPSLFGL
jgi:tripartite ATP-independent transporter DctM subunit